MSDARFAESVFRRAWCDSRGHVGRTVVQVASFLAVDTVIGAIAGAAADKGLGAVVAGTAAGVSLLTIVVWNLGRALVDQRNQARVERLTFAACVRELEREGTASRRSDSGKARATIHEIREAAQRLLHRVRHELVGSGPGMQLGSPEDQVVSIVRWARRAADSLAAIDPRLGDEFGSVANDAFPAARQPNMRRFLEDRIRRLDAMLDSTVHDR